MSKTKCELNHIFLRYKPTTILTRGFSVLVTGCMFACTEPVAPITTLDTGWESRGNFSILGTGCTCFRSFALLGNICMSSGAWLRSHFFLRLAQNANFPALDKG